MTSTRSRALILTSVRQMKLSWLSSVIKTPIVLTPRGRMDADVKTDLSEMVVYVKIKMSAH